MDAGVDEAGRGPVLGPLVVAGVAGRIEDVPDGTADSKALTPSRRAALDTAIRRAPGLALAVREITADELNTRMSASESLNEIEAVAFTSVLDELGATRAIVDTVGTDARAFGTQLTAATTACQVRAEPQADATYPLVAAASIVAKVARDRAIEGIADTLGANIGSGYPSDPATRAFLAEWRETSATPPPHTRIHWRTIQDLCFGTARLTDFPLQRRAP